MEKKNAPVNLGYDGTADQRWKSTISSLRWRQRMKLKQNESEAGDNSSRESLPQWLTSELMQ